MPRTSRDSALLLTLGPGAYTAQVGASGSGLALVEIYDATSTAQPSTEQLINISTRGYVDSGDGNTAMARNDDWEKPQAPANADEVRAAATATGAFPLLRGSKDAAILITLMPGSYSAVLRGATASTGADLIEVYEVPNL